MLNHLESPNNKRVAPKLKMVTLDDIKYKPIGSNAFPLILKLWKYTNLHN